MTTIDQRKHQRNQKPIHQLNNRQRHVQYFHIERHRFEYVLHRFQITHLRGSVSTNKDLTAIQLRFHYDFNRSRTTAVTEMQCQFSTLDVSSFFFTKLATN